MGNNNPQTSTIIKKKSICFENSKEGKDAFYFQKLALDYLNERRKNEALDQCQKALQIIETYSRNTCNHANCLNCLGSIYNGLEDYEKAIPVLENALKIIESFPEKKNEKGMILMNLASSYKAIENFENVQLLLEKANYL